MNSKTYVRAFVHPSHELSEKGKGIMSWPLPFILGCAHLQGTSLLQGLLLLLIYTIDAVLVLE